MKTAKELKEKEREINCIQIKVDAETESLKETISNFVLDHLKNSEIVFNSHIYVNEKNGMNILRINKVFLSDNKIYVGYENKKYYFENIDLSDQLLICEIIENKMKK